MKRYRNWIVLVVAVVVSLFISCSNDDETNTRKYLATQNPGDVWVWIFTDDTFDATNEETGYNYTGRLEKMANKFLKLTIETTTDPDTSIIGAIAYAMEVPRTLLIIKPPHATDVIVGAALGTCPEGNGTYNAVQLPWPGWDAATSQAYSVIDVTVSGSNLSVSSDKYLIDGSSAGHEDSTGFTCVDGRVTRATDATVVVVAPSGAFVTDQGSGNGGTFGTVQPSANVDMNVVLASGREFRGVVFNDIGTATEDTQPVWVRPAGSSGMIGGGYSDFEGNVEDSTDTVSITFTGQATPGIVNGTHTDSHSGTLGNSVYIVNHIGGRYVIYGMVVTPGAGAPDIFIVAEAP